MALYKLKASGGQNKSKGCKSTFIFLYGQSLFIEERREGNIPTVCLHFLKKKTMIFFGNTIKIISCNTKPCTGLPMCPVLNFRKIEWVVLAYMGTLHTS